MYILLEFPGIPWLKCDGNDNVCDDGCKRLRWRLQTFAVKIGKLGVGFCRLILGQSRVGEGRRCQCLIVVSPQALCLSDEPSRRPWYQ